MENLMAKQTRCLLAQPGFSSNGFFNYSDVARFVNAKCAAAPLGLMTVAALLPQHWEFRLVEERFELGEGQLEFLQLDPQALAGKMEEPRALLEASLEAEMTEHLGYEKHDPAGRQKGSNSRNGTRE